MSRPKYRRPRVAEEIGMQCKRANGKAKSAYRSPAKARQAIRENRSNRVPLYVYQCPHCGYWHITSRPQLTDADWAQLRRHRKGGAS